jgi:hypothetical protein
VLPVAVHTVVLEHVGLRGHISTVGIIVEQVTESMTSSHPRKGGIVELSTPTQLSTEQAAESRTSHRLALFKLTDLVQYACKAACVVKLTETIEKIQIQARQLLRRSVTDRFEHGIRKMERKTSVKPYRATDLCRRDGRS